MSANDNHKPLPPFPNGSPEKGEHWQHEKSGNVYRIVSTPYDEETLGHRVVYTLHDGAPEFDRTLLSFMESFRRI